MKTCDRKHPPNVICEDRHCIWGDRNPFLRLLRRFDRLAHENQNLKSALSRRMTKSEGV